MANIMQMEEFEQWRQILDMVDAVAVELEAKWGVDRLPKLVAPDLAGRFYSQRDKLNAALDVGTPADREFHGGRMLNAWRALDRAATAAGALPLSPKQIEGRLPDGRVLIVTDTLEGAHKLARENRAAVVYSIEEVTRLLWNFEMVNEAKIRFEGATVEENRPAKPVVDWRQGDELPIGLQALGAG